MKLQRAAAEVVIALSLAVCAAAAGCDRPPTVQDRPELSMKKPSAEEEHSQEELQQRLTPLQYRVTQQSATEPPFRNEYWNEARAGIYVDVVSGEALFSSLDKFDSGTGWPSFGRALDRDNIVTRTDDELGVTRTEVRSKRGDSHLGHVFADGPAPSGTRYCINSAALRFIPVAELESAGYGQYASLFRPAEESANVPGRAVATLAAGCFWGVEEILRTLPGVLDTTVGYTGGSVANPSYEQICTDRTGHAEAVQVVYDPARISYGTLLETFFRLHDPTTRNRQGNDVGTQYRSAIFVQDEEQRRVAGEVMKRVQASGKHDGEIVTEIAPAATFYPAEPHHQDYLQKHPHGYSCHYLRD